MREKIKKIIGKFLEEYGYKYIKEDDPVKCTFAKEENGIIKSISIIRSIHGKQLSLYFGNSNYYKKGKLNQQFNVGVVDPKLRKNVVFDYEKKDELVRVLYEINEIIKEYGFSFLDYLSKERINISLEEVNKSLSEDPKKRAKNFTDKYNLKYEENQLIKVMEIIDNEIKNNENYDKELLVDMSAYLGEMIIKYIGGKWGVCSGPNVFCIIDKLYEGNRGVLHPTNLIKDYIDLGEVYAYKIDFQFNTLKGLTF